MTRQEQINNALMADVDLTEEEYKEKRILADKISSKNGVKNEKPGKMPVSEKIRHDRIEVNYYGTALNIMMGLYSAMSDLTVLCAEILSKLNGGADNGSAETKHDPA